MRGAHTKGRPQGLVSACKHPATGAPATVAGCLASCSTARRLNMAEQKLRISAKADIRGIRPEDITNGANYRITADKDTPILVADERTPKKGKGSFTQYTLNLVDSKNVDCQLRFLFERHLAPLARAWGEDPEAWTGRLIHVKGVQVQREAGTFWDVEVDAVSE